MATLNASLNLREEVPVNIIKGANLEKTINDLFKNFEAGEQRNAELINRFFDQTYFRGEESLINKLIEVKHDIKFDDIEDEGINLALLVYNDRTYDFKICIEKIKNPRIKEQIIKEIHDKIQAIIGVGIPYDHFDDPNQCRITPGDTNVLGYFTKVINYLKEKEGVANGKKVLEILKDIVITNKDINAALPAGEQIPTGANLTDASIPEDTKNDFDYLLSFEIGKEADRTTTIAKNFSKDFQKLLTNSLPAINTIVGESEEYRYEEEKLGSEYKGKLQVISNNTTLSEKERNKQINNLRREYYIKYLKSKNTKIGNTLEQLYNNDFDYSKIERNTLKDYFDKVADIRLSMLFDKSTSSGLCMNELMNLNFGNIDEFKNFYKELTDVDPRNPTLNITLSDVNVPGSIPARTGTINIPIQRKIIEGENRRLKDIEQFGKNANKPFDAFPMEFTIKKSDINALNITIEDKTKLLNLLSKFDKGDRYEIKGENIGILIYLFFIINSKYPITEINAENQQEIEDLFGHAKNHKNMPENDESEENEASTPEKFKEDIEKLGPGKFEEGSEIWLPIGNSELPGGGYQWMKIKISNINMKKGKFKGTIFGGELKFSDKYEGKSKEFKMDEGTLKKIKESSKKASDSENNVRLQPNPDKSDFNSFREKLNGNLGTNKLSFPAAGVTWDGNKFTQKILDENDKEKEVEVKYFGASNDDKSTYKIEYNPNKRHFTVSSSFNGEEKGKNGKSDKKRFSYKRDMDWNNFLIFFSQKGLIPQTEEEANSAIARQDQEFKMVNSGNWKLNWFSIINIKNAFKSLKGNIKKKIDNYNKTQDEKLEDILVGDRGLYSKLASVVGFIPSMKEGLGELEQEYYNERDSRTWKKIEYYLKIFQADPDFGTTFENIPPHAKIQGGKSLQQIVLNRVANAQNRMGDPGIYQAAALLLANIEKGGSPYRGLSGEENSGLWIKALLGKAHYEQFMRDKQKCINDLKNAGKEKDQIQDVLATCEMDYIINNVSGANGKLKYFGSHEDRGIPGKEGTNYIDNPSKRILSNQFADKLKGAYKGRFDGKSVENAFDNIKHNDFNLAKEDFKRLLKSSRFPGALANLKKMFLLAKNDEQKTEYQKCFLVYILSGVLDVNGKKDLRKQTYQWAKTMGFLPGMLAKNTNHSEQVVTLLDDWSGGDFSKNIKSYFHEGDLKNGKLKVESLISELDSRWNLDKMKNFEKYSKHTFPSKDFPKGSVLKALQESALNTNRENIDDSLLANPTIANSGGLLSNINVVRDRMEIKDGEFTGKDNDERNNKKEFRDKITDEIQKTTINVENLELLLKQYCEWFQIYDKEKTYRWIKTAYHRKDKVGTEYEYKDDNGNRDKMGKITSKEIKSILWYTFQGNAMSAYFSGRRLPEEIKKTLKAFQDKFEEAFNSGVLKDPKIVSNIFGIGNEGNIQPLLLGSWDVYNRTVTGREYSSDDDDKKAKNRIKRNFQSGNFINYEIATMEKRLKNLSSIDYESVTTNTLDDLLDRFRST